MSENRKQYHFIVMIDSKGNVSIDADTTKVMLEERNGTVFDPDTEEWELGFGNPDYLAIGDRLSEVLYDLQVIPEKEAN